MLVGPRKAAWNAEDETPAVPSRRLLKSQTSLFAGRDGSTRRPRGRLRFALDPEPSELLPNRLDALPVQAVLVLELLELRHGRPLLFPSL